MHAKILVPDDCIFNYLMIYLVGYNNPRKCQILEKLVLLYFKLAYINISLKSFLGTQGRSYRRICRINYTGPPGHGGPKVCKEKEIKTS